MERSTSVFKYYGNKFINDKMKKAKKNEEKLKKTRNIINPLNQKDFEDNNISILFSSFNILKSNKMEEKDLTLILKIKTKMTRNTRTLCFQFTLTIPKMKMKIKKMKKKMKKWKKMRKKITSSIII